MYNSQLYKNSENIDNLIVNFSGHKVHKNNKIIKHSKKTKKLKKKMFS